MLQSKKGESINENADRNMLPGWLRKSSARSAPQQNARLTCVHPGTSPAWQSGWTGPEGGPPLGVNKGMLDGSVRWVPEEEAVPSYPGGGGNPMSLKWRLIE